MASSSKQQPEEFVVRVPKLSKTKKIEILKFNANLNVDVTQWSNVSLTREDNSSVFVNPSDQPKDGVGSEFGKQSRDEARRKKMGYEARRYKKDDQPWLMNINTVTPTSKTTKKYRGIREGGVTQNADFWVFVKSGDGVFDALPVDEWYSFMPVARYKTLDAEEAEEQFSKLAVFLIYIFEGSWTVC